MRIKAYLKQVFSTLGLTEGKADIMAALLKKPGSDANTLKSKLGFSTTGTYKILGALSEKGYIKPSQEKNPLTFTPIPLGKLAQTFERNSRHLQRTAQKLKEPFPTVCPSCRYQKRLSLKNPHELWERPCSKCHEMILGPHRPEDPKLVYCQKCYLKEK